MSDKVIDVTDESFEDIVQRMLKELEVSYIRKAEYNEATNQATIYFGDGAVYRLYLTQIN